MIQTHDVIIAGGGLAGLTLAIQLKSASPDLDVVVLENKTFPVPETTAKVGESTVEIGSHYLTEVIGLQDHFDEKHLRKFGLRCFMGEPQKEFSQLDEIGVSNLFGIPTYQIDRGVLENELYDKASACGVNIIDGVNTSNLKMEAQQQQIDISSNDETKTLKSRWLLDAAGRRSLVKNELSLEQENDHKGNAVWFRIDRKIVIDEWATEEEWQQRTYEPRKRWLSTNHLMGPGYWVWIIPLGTGATSIGIVMDDQVCDEAKLDNYDKAYAWLAENQPQCAEAISGAKVLDYVAIRDYSYDCKKVFSDDGWGLSGEAGLFADPFYSPGSDLIAISNTFINELVKQQQLKQDIRFESSVYNSLQKTFFDSTLSLYTHQYGGFGDRTMMGAKLLWDYSYYWGVLSLLYFNNTFIDIEKMRELNPILLKTKMLNQQVQEKMRMRASKRLRIPAQGIFLDQYLIPCLRHFNHVLQKTDMIDVKKELEANTMMLERIASYAIDLISDNPSKTVSDNERELLGDYRKSVLA